MRSIRYTAFGNPAEVLRVEDVPTPTPRPGQVLLRLQARPINPSDLFQIRGAYGILPRLPATPGMEGAGVIEALGEGVEGLRVGQLAVPLGPIGTWQEYLAADANALLPLPEELDIRAAAMLVANPTTAWLLLHDQGTAEDVVQDAFIATHRNYDRIRDSGAAVAYLRRAVVNGARSVHRHDLVVRRELVAEAGRADAVDRATAASAEAQALRHLGDGAMLAALRRLPDRQREVLVLRYFADWSEAAIADALGIAPGSVKAHAHRGLATLRARLEATG
jgi:RNA polymerase sigma-70 factor (sigma-E family)